MVHSCLSLPVSGASSISDSDCSFSRFVRAPSTAGFRASFLMFFISPLRTLHKLYHGFDYYKAVPRLSVTTVGLCSSYSSPVQYYVLVLRLPYVVTRTLLMNDKYYVTGRLVWRLYVCYTNQELSQDSSKRNHT